MMQAQRCGAGPISMSRRADGSVRALLTVAIRVEHLDAPSQTDLVHWPASCLVRGLDLRRIERAIAIEVKLPECGLEMACAGGQGTS